MRRAGHSFAAALALYLCLCLAAASWAATASSETYAQLVAQINSGSVARALVNRGGHDVKVTLRDATIDRVIYPSHQEHQLVALLHAHNAHVTYTRHRKAAHHVLRYIALAIVVVILAAGGGMFAYTRRRQATGGPTA